MKIRKIFDKISKAIDAGESLVCFILLAVTVVIGFAQVLCRVLHAALPWSEELLRYCFVWLTFMGAGLGIGAGTHLSVEFFAGLFPKKAQRILAAFAMILVLLFCNQVFLKGVIVVKTAVMTHMKSSAMRIPMWIPYPERFNGSEDSVFTEDLARMMAMVAALAIEKYDRERQQ